MVMQLAGQDKNKAREALHNEYVEYMCHVLGLDPEEFLSIYFDMMKKTMSEQKPSESNDNQKKLSPVTEEIVNSATNDNVPELVSTDENIGVNSVAED